MSQLPKEELRRIIAESKKRIEERRAMHASHAVEQPQQSLLETLQAIIKKATLPEEAI